MQRRSVFGFVFFLDSVLSRLLYFPAAVDSTGHQKTKDIPQPELPPHKFVTGPDCEQSVSAHCQFGRF